jgi:threonine dehydrogenase-like Zn-dependent dehydrogenase
MDRNGRAVVLTEPYGHFLVKEYPKPEPKEGTMLIQQEMCGVCGTDVHIYKGQLPGIRYPIVLGHEIVGKIEKLGEGIKKDIVGNFVTEGDRVILIPGLSCGKCYMCKVLKEPGNCLNEASYGFFGPADDEPHFLGGYADYIYMAHPNSDFLKTSLPPEIAVLVEPFSIGIRCAEKAELKAGDIVVIQGAGAIGLFTLIAAKESGASKTIVIGGPKRRLELAREFGADTTIDINEVRDSQERIKIVKKLTTLELGADVVFECTGVPAAVPEGIEMVRPCGRFIEAGHFTDNGTCQINPYSHIVRKSLTIASVYGSEVRHFVRALSILDTHNYPFEKIVSHVLPLERVMDAMNAMMSGYRLDGEEVIKIAISSLV